MGGYENAVCKIGGSDNALRHTLLTILCSVALAWICVGLAPITAQAEGDFHLTVGSYEITADGQITGDPLVQGTVTWDPESHTLTLNNATITGKTDEDGGHEAICASHGDLTIKLIGTNRISSDNAGIVVYNGGLTIEGPGSFEITDTSESGCGIIPENYLKVNGLQSLIVNVNADADGSGLASLGTLEISDLGSLTVNAAYGITSGCRAVTLRNIGNLTVSSQYDAIDSGGDSSSDAIALFIEGSPNGTSHNNIYVSGASQLTLDGWIQSRECDMQLHLTPSTGGDVAVTVGGYQFDDGNRQYVEEPYSYEDENGGVVTSPFKEQIVIPSYILSRLKYLQTEDSAANLVPASSGGKAETEEKGGHHKHVYEWETYKAATATTDGIMRYRCKTCGTVEYEVPTAAYYVFNKDAQQAIQNAAANATVTVSTDIFISFHEMVAEALTERPDVTLVVDYKNAGKSYEMTIPAGSGSTLDTLFGDSQFAGFLYLGGAFATVER